MHEYVTVSSSSYDPASLAAKLTEKSAEGWHVVAIVPTGGDVTAFLSRTVQGADDAEAGANETAAAAAGTAAAESMPESSAPDVAVEPAVVAEPTPEPVSEPAGWAVAPAAEPAAEPAVAVAPAPEPVVEVAATAPVAPAVPAGWYADPAGRFELRYWDGGTWTEHVSRAGQQYTDPPVA